MTPEDYCGSRVQHVNHVWWDALGRHYCSGIPPVTTEPEVEPEEIEQIPSESCWRTSSGHPAHTWVNDDYVRLFCDGSPQEEVEHVTLVAFVTTGPDVEQAQDRLMAMLPTPEDTEHLDSWWVADDSLGYSHDHDVRRIDGSDNDSAVFCRPKTQEQSARMLYALGLTEECNANLGVSKAVRVEEILDGLAMLTDHLSDLLPKEL